MIVTLGHSGQAVREECMDQLEQLQHEVLELEERLRLRASDFLSELSVRTYNRCVSAAARCCMLTAAFTALRPQYAAIELCDSPLHLATAD